MDTRAAVAVLAVVITAGTLCQDARDWTDGETTCAYDQDGHNPAWCKPTPGAAWPSTAGWTCDYYRHKGWCKDGVSNENSQMGLYKNWPERHCCGCAPLPDASCNTNTGKGCKMSSCGFSQGPTFCENLTTCKCQPGHCAGSSGICSLYQPKTSVTTLAALATASGQSAAAAGGVQSEGTCVDTQDWSNLWSGCAWQPDGKNATLCRPTQGASWPSTAGWACEYYRAKGLCKDGSITFASGELHNFPEINCCGCAKPIATSCNRNTGGTCAMGSCDASRGPTVCVNGTCLCKPGRCGTSDGYCSLQPETDADVLVMYDTNGKTKSRDWPVSARADLSTPFIIVSMMIIVVLGSLQVYRRSIHTTSGKRELHADIEEVAE